jgi:predicted GNAT family acetyltransferase
MSFRDNPALRRYEFVEDGFLSFANYRDIGAVRAITHVETPSEARGRGHASKLMGEIVDEARERGLRLRASCAFAVVYFKRHAAAVAPIEA